MVFSSSFKLLAMALVLAVMLLMSSKIVEATPNFKLGRRALDGVPYWGGYIEPPEIPRSGGYHTPSP